MSINEIIISKARVHNLKDVSLSIPKNSLTVITGPSGSGKSSLAFDTIYVEGQRRYIESLSSYARQFLGQFQPPDVESISGLSPAIAIDQKTSSKNPRSTVGTITEVYDYLRILFARAGTLFSPINGAEVKQYTPHQILLTLLTYPEKTKLHIMSPFSADSAASFTKQLTKFTAMGFSRIYIDGEVKGIEECSKAKGKGPFNAHVVVDRVLIKNEIEKRLTDSIEYALKVSNGFVSVLIGEGDSEEFVTFSEHNMAPGDDTVYPNLEPRLFSFNSPVGACPKCNGLGESKSFDEALMVTDTSLSIEDGAIGPIAKRNRFLYNMVVCVAEAEGIDINAPLKKLSKKNIDLLFHGSGDVYTFSFTSENSHFEFTKEFPGIVNWLDKKYHETGSEKVRAELENFMHITKCSACQGQRLNPIALSTKIGNRNIIELAELSIEEAYDWFSKLSLEGERKIISEKILKEINSRLKFLLDVGLDYLTLNRSAMSLSGGESQRIRLATQIGSALSGVLYVLDEPSIGLHQRDNDRLIETLKSLRDLGNTVLVVEHDEDTMRASDYIIDMGPGAGIHGGTIVAKGTPAEIEKKQGSLTAAYLKGESAIDVPKQRREAQGKIKLSGASENNLKKLTTEFPLGVLTCVTGVSGSGKSTLIHRVLVPAVKEKLSRKGDTFGPKNYNSLTGTDALKSLIELDQSPIGRTPHSNPATYTGLFDEIRTLYSKTPESQIRGYKPGRFSFNVKGGRCEECEGNGVKKIEMHFLPDVFITCQSCYGKRYNPDTLSVLYKGKNIADVLDMSIEEAYEFFKNHTKAARVLKTMLDVGLGYIKLGQPATTLSGGEAQRLKLSRELSKSTRGHCLYVLDEPTTGLHFEDIRILLKAINDLVDQGNSVIVIEHNLDVIKTADHVIDLGPEGGSRGGTVLVAGSPEDVAKESKSYTGKYLKKYLK